MSQRKRNSLLALSLAVACGGALGGLLRSALHELESGSLGSWPWPTLIANVIGTFLLGYWSTVLTLPTQGARRALLTVGICGGLTTFATLQLELVRLIENADATSVVSYLAATLALGWLGLQAGLTLGARKDVALGRAVPEVSGGEFED